jgi:regulation of enolase protein 1 (concanavalin A-like superfamily)
VPFLAFVASANDSQSVVIDGWGTVHDPDGDCKIFIEDDKVTITVPDEPHDMNPDRGPVNAPRILREVTGDFTLRVRVTGDFEPGKETTNPRSAPFNGAGLLLWMGEEDYVRLERNVWLRGEDQRQCFPPLFQAFKDGVDQGTNPPLTTKEFFVGESTWLRFERRGAALTASCSHDGDEWVFAKRIELEIPETVHVGVSASNTSNHPFRVTFDQYKLKAKKQSRRPRTSR